MIDQIAQIAHALVELTVAVGVVLGLILGKNSVVAQQVQAAGSKAKELDAVGMSLLHTIAAKNDIPVAAVDINAHGVDGVPAIKVLADAQKVSADTAERVLVGLQNRIGGR